MIVEDNVDEELSQPLVAQQLLRFYAAGYRIVYKHHGDYTFLQP